MTYRTFDGTSQVEAITNGRFSSDGTQYLKDSETINVGTSSDLKILHDGSNSIISDEGTGQLKLQTNGENIQLNKGTTENMIVARTDGSVDLYHDNTKKFETTAAGANISGRALIGTTTLAPYASRILTVGDTGTDDTALEIRSSDDTTGRLYFTDSASAGEGAYQGELTFNHSDNSFYLKINSETSLKSVKDGAVELNYNGVKKFETTSVGVKVTGNYQAVDGYHIYMGTGNDLDIYHDGSDSYIDDAGTGSILIRSDTHVRINKQSAAESMATFTPDGAVELYYDAVKKFETTADGVQVTGKIFSSSHLDFADDVKLLLGTGDDLEIFHDGTINWIDSVNNHAMKVSAGTGNLFLQGANVRIGVEGQAEYCAKFIADGAVE